MTNKARREELARLKHLRRCRAMGVKPEEFYCYKAQGKPCSCWLCSPEKYSRKGKGGKTDLSANFET